MADLGDLGTNVMTCDTQVLICLSRCECWWWQFHSRGYRGHGCLLLVAQKVTVSQGVSVLSEGV